MATETMFTVRNHFKYVACLRRVDNFCMLLEEKLDVNGKADVSRLTLCQSKLVCSDKGKRSKRQLTTEKHSTM